MSEMKVTVKVGYNDIIETEDLVLCASILNLIAQHQDTNPPTAEEQLLYELRKAKEEAEVKSNSWEFRASRAEKELSKLKVEVERLKSPASVSNIPAETP